MKILLDTNIIIHREASKVINEDIGVLFNWIDRLHYRKFVHPVTIDEIKKHSDPDVVKTMKIKIGNFLYVYSFPIPYVNLKRLLELGIISSIDSVPRGFEKISDINFETLIKETNTNEDFIID